MLLCLITETGHALASGGSGARSGLPGDHLDGDVGVFGHEGLRLRVLLRHFFQLGQALFEFLARRWVLGHRRNQLHVVEARLLLQVVKQLNDQVELVEVVDLNFALLQLRERGQRSNRRGSHVGNGVR
jgi:hypothetical protein